MLWYELTGGIELLSNATKYYSQFLRQLQCGGDLYPGQGPVCQYNATHNGSCSADCIRGLEESGEFCGCSGGTGLQCPNSPVHIRCCLDTCTQELKLDVGFVLDASGSVGVVNYQIQLNFTKDLLRRLNVGANKTHVAIINFSDLIQNLTSLNTDYSLEEKLNAMDNATYYSRGTHTGEALVVANAMFSSANGLRSAEQGAVPVIFVITDGKSNGAIPPIPVAEQLKNKSITIVSVGVGNSLNLAELYGICTPPASENYFPISNYAALNEKLNQFTSRSCSEPTSLPTNTTVFGQVPKDKYKFLTINAISIRDDMLIKVKLLDGKVKLFYSFTSRNPKDPEDFLRYETNATRSMSHRQIMSKSTKNKNGEETLVIEKPSSNADYVYLGIKGIEANNKFEVNFHDYIKVTSGDSTTVASGDSTTVTSGDSTKVTPVSSTKVTPGSSTKATSGDSTKVTPGSSTKVTPGSSTKATSGDSTKVTPGSSTKVTPGSTTKVTPGSSTTVTPGSSTQLTRNSATMKSSTMLFAFFSILLCFLCKN